MKKQVPAMVLAVLCVVLVVVCIKNKKTIDRLQAKIDRSKATKVDVTGEESIVGLDASEDAMLDQGDATPEGVSAGGEIVVDIEQPEELVSESDEGRRMMENISKMMENPAMNEMIQASQRGALSAMYADMIEYLGLNDEEADYFMDLLMYRQSMQTELAMKLMSGQLNDEEREALQKKMEEVQETYKEEMASFLNDDGDYAHLEFYEKTTTERMMMSQVDKDLSGTAGELASETYEELINIMYSEKESYDYSNNLADQDNMDLSSDRFSSSNVDAYANDLQGLNQAILEEASGVLSAEQYSAFESSLTSYTEMQIAQMKMAAQMLSDE